MGDVKAVVSAVLVLALSVTIGLHLGLLWTSNGRLLIGESNRTIMIVESVMAAAIFVFGIERFVAALRAHSSGPED